jgi:hypothetical protein
MRLFDVLVAQPGASLNQVVSAMVESNTPGLLVNDKSGDWRLIHFGALAYVAHSAIEGNYTASLDMVPSESVFDAKTADPQAAVAKVAASGMRFGLLGQKGDRADLVSLSETYSFAFDIATSLASRCTRPNKPAGTANGDWYHYYPPRTRQAAPDQDICGACKSPIA